MCSILINKHVLYALHSVTVKTEPYLAIAMSRFVIGDECSSVTI